MKKRLICLMAAMLVAMTAASCTEGAENSTGGESSAVQSSTQEQTSEEVSIEESSIEESKEEPAVSETEKLEKEPIPEGAELITNLNYANGNNKMGDADGPAVCVYAPDGWNKASLDIAFSKMNINTVRKSDGKYLNGYVFLGIDVLSGPGGRWINCFDAGFCWSGKKGGWHLFYNVYANVTEGEPTWYESKTILDITHDYRLTVDSSYKDEEVTVSIYDISDGDKLADSVKFSVKGLKCDGSNTAYYQDYALDFPNDVIVEENGKVGSVYANADWVKSTLHSTDENVYMQNILITDAKLYKDGVASQWTEGNWGVWPDSAVTGIDYSCTTIIKGDGYYNYRVDLDMNRG